MFELGALLALGLAAIGAVVEVVRLEGRINSHDTLFGEREKLTDAHHTELTAWLVRIEAKLDESLQIKDRSRE